MGLERSGQHVGSVNMGAAEVLRTRFALGVGLHKEAAKVGNQLVDLVHLILPPTDDISIERIGSLQSTNLDGRCEIDGEVDTDAIGAQLVGNGLRFRKTLGSQGLGLGIHIIEHGAIDADRRAGARVHFHMFRGGVQKDTLASKAALDGAVRIVPMVQDTQVVGWRFLDTEVVAGLTHLLEAQQVVGAIEQSGVAGSSYHGLAALTRNGITVGSQALLTF